MPKVVYGVFANDGAADRALAEINRGDRHEAMNAVVHEHHLREEDVQLGGTSALAGMIIGGVVVGGFGALIAWLVVWPLAGYSFGFGAAMLMLLAGSVFGVVAGAVAGASECRDSVRHAADRAAKSGEVLVTCEVDGRDDMDRVIEAFNATGGHDVQAA